MGSTGARAISPLFRLNYIFRTIDNFYVVFNETRWTGGRFANRANRSLVMKLTYSVHR